MDMAAETVAVLALAPEQTVEKNGEGAPVEAGAFAGQRLLARLNITHILEQESLDVAVLGSADGADWSGQALAAFPQKFYAGQHEMLLDLGRRSEVRFLRAKWTVNRWGKGAPTPRFTFSVSVRPLARTA